MDSINNHKIEPICLTLSNKICKTRTNALDIPFQYSYASRL